MKDGSQQLLEKAQRSIEAGQDLLVKGHLEFATGRAYYAMFYIAEALLNEKGLRFSKHGGVHGAFGEHYVKTGLFDAKYHRWLLDSFDQRIMGDYNVAFELTLEEVSVLIDQAIEFLEEARRFL
jgi:uncharacterized protein (UPF0332 family)